MGILGFMAAMLFLSFIEWLRKDKKVKIKTDNEMKIMEKDVLKNLIEKQNLNYEFFEEDNNCLAFKMRFQTENANFDVIVTLNKQTPFLLSIYTYFPQDVPNPKRLAVSELITYINSGLSVGNLEMNMANGTLVSKISYFYDDSGSENNNLFSLYFKNSYILLDCYFHAIMTVIYSEKTAKDVYSEFMSQLDVSLN